MLSIDSTMSTGALIFVSGETCNPFPFAEENGQQEGVKRIKPFDKHRVRGQAGTTPVRT